MTSMSWRRSTHCGPNNTCIELAADGAAVSDSAHPDRPTIPITPRELRTLINAIKEQP